MQHPQELPVLQKKAEIKAAIRKYDVVIVAAPTGSGKTTEVPLMALEVALEMAKEAKKSAQKVLIPVTQPRVLAAVSLAERVAKRMKVAVGKKVGYVTGKRSKASDETQILFCTDGVQLPRAMDEARAGRDTIVILDEVHERNLNTDTLMAYYKWRLKQGDKLKLIIMSATIDAQRFADYFGANACIVKAEGRQYPVTECHRPADKLYETIQELVGQKRNTLVFVPGKPEIEEVIARLYEMGLEAEILPAHGELDLEQQQLIFEEYERCKVIIGTNVLQTSITVKDIDAVVDTGLMNVMKVVDGVDTLCQDEPIGQDDSKQRAGRAGRCKEGLYFLCSKWTYNQLPMNATPQIKLCRKEHLILRMALLGLDMSVLEFLDQPDPKEIARDRQSLVALGALEADGKIVTNIGREMVEMPVDMCYARMLVEAKARGCFYRMVTLVAIMQSGGLRDKTGAWRAYTQETSCDLFAELDIWEAIHGRIGDAIEDEQIADAPSVYKAKRRSKTNAELKAMGVWAKHFRLAKDLRRQILNGIDTCDINEPKDKPLDREAILKAYMVGMVGHLYTREDSIWRKKNKDDWYTNGKANRVIANESAMTARPEYIVAKPKDLGTNFGILTYVAEVKLEWLYEVAPHLIAIEGGIDARYEYTGEEELVAVPGQEFPSLRQKGVVKGTCRISFNGYVISEERVVMPPSHPKAKAIMAQREANN